MSETSIKVRLPALPDPTIFADPERTIRTTDGSTLLTYDPGTRAGFIYAIEQQRWSITAPVDFDAFAGLLALSGYSITEGEDAHRWLRACGARAGRKTH